MGKWAKFKSILPKFAGNDRTFAERVEALKTKICEAPGEDDPNEETITQELEVVQRMVDKVVNRAVFLLSKRTTGQRYASRFAQGYRDARRLRETLTMNAKVMSAFIQAYTELFDEQADNEGVTSVKLDDGSSLRSQPEPFTTVEDKEKFRQWAVANGYEHEMVLPWGTTNALVKERLENGDEEPPGVKVWWKPKVVPNGMGFKEKGNGDAEG